MEWPHYQLLAVTGTKHNYSERQPTVALDTGQNKNKKAEIQNIANISVPQILLSLLNLLGVNAWTGKMRFDKMCYLQMARNGLICYGPDFFLVKVL